MNAKQIMVGVYNNLPPHIRHMFGCYNQVYHFYQEAQWWPIDKIKNWQLSRLISMVKYAYDNTSGYHQLYSEAGFKPSDIQTLKDVSLIPFTNKELLKNNIEEFTVSKSISGWLHKGATSGSTGMPFVFYSDVKNSAAESAFMDTAWESIGWSPNDIGVRLRGGFIDDKELQLHKLSYGRYGIASQSICEANYERIIELVQRSKASFLHVYPSTIYELSKLIISHNDVDRLKIKHIFIGSEHLYDWQLKNIERAFPSSKLMHWYGHSERAIWAPWCELEQKFHVCPFYGLAEVLDGDCPVLTEGEKGELVGTSFWMFGTPFIRYRTGDIAEYGGNNTECGRHFMTLNSIDGRLQDFVIDKEGKAFSLTIFDGWAMHGENFSNISCFRFVQKVKGELILQVVPSEKYNSDDRENLQFKLSEFFKEFEVKLEEVKELPKSKSGKYSYLEQHLNTDSFDNLKSNL